MICLVFATGVCRTGLPATPSGVAEPDGWRMTTWPSRAGRSVEFIWAVYDVRPELDHASHPAAADDCAAAVPNWRHHVVGAAARATPVGHNLWRLVLDGIIVGDFAVRGLVGVRPRQICSARTAARGSRPSCTSSSMSSLMTTAILVLSRDRPGGRRSMSLFAAGVTTIGVADMLVVFRPGVGSYHTGDLVDVSRVAGLGMVALAGPGRASTSLPPAASRPRSPLAPAMWLPYLPLLLAAAVGLGRAVHTMRHGPLLVGDWGSWWSRCWSAARRAGRKPGLVDAKWPRRLSATA